MEISSSNFSKDIQRKNVSKRSSVIQDRHGFNSSVTSIRSKNPQKKDIGNRVEMNYKEKYEKMKVTNIKLQENLDRLVGKHQKLLTLFQNVQNDNERQKKLIEKYQNANGRNSNVTQQAKKSAKESVKQIHLKY